MKEIVNKIGNITKVYANIFEDEAQMQVKKMANYEPYLNSKIRIMPDAHAGKGCVIGTTMTLDSAVTPNLVGVDIGCLDCDTEVLTPNGWIKISDYDGQKILQYDPNTDTGVFEIPALYIIKDCEYFYHFKNSKGLDQMISDEHNMLVYSGHNGKLNWNRQRPSFFFDKNGLEKGYYRFKTCFNIFGEGLDIPDYMIKLHIMVQADCRIREYDDYNYVEAHFRKLRKIDRARKMLFDADIPFKETLSNDGSVFFYFKVPKFINKDLSIYYKANKRQLEIIKDECLLWDGHKGYRSFYCSRDKTNVDLIQFAFISTNTRASLYKQKKTNESYSDIYSVIPTKNEYVGYTVQPIKVPSKDGKKYCFTTKTGFFLCRRNGYTFLTGNCGMLAGYLTVNDIDLKKLDDVIRKYVPSGFSVHQTPISCFDLQSLYCYNAIKEKDDYIQQSLGTLGGGNHFIEVNKTSDGQIMIVIHSGSRNLGVQVCNYYQKLAVDTLSKQTDVKAVIEKLKSEGREKEIQSELKKIKSHVVDKKLAHLTGTDFEHYIHDMEIVQRYASMNRSLILNIICRNMGFYTWDYISTIHNYIDVDNMILRKGAVSAQNGEKLIIPMNMRDGSLICVGKGNPDWNYSAPHGAGRLMSREKAKKSISIQDFSNVMSGIYTTSVCEETLDEAPQAYKSMDEIMSLIGDTVEVIDIVKPIYNFKAN